MNTLRAARLARTAVFAAIVALLAGCGRPSGYTAPVSKFRDASAVVIESTKVYLLALNKTERDHYIDDQVANRAPIQLTRMAEVQVFGAEAIAARLDALDQLANYTELLYRLATHDAPATIKGQARDLATAVENLSTEVSTLARADDARFKEAASAVFPIIGDVLKAAVDDRLDDALTKAVTMGAAPVNRLIEAIKIDAEVAYERTRNALSKRRADAALAYNVESAKGPKAAAGTLRRLANAISDAEDEWEAFQTARPAAGLDAMQDANLALEKFARTRRPRVTDLATFVEAMEVFASAAARLGQGVRRLTELQERGER